MSQCSWFLSRIKLKRNKSTKITAEISLWQHVLSLLRPELFSSNKVDSFVSLFFLSLFLPFSARRTPINNITSFRFYVTQCSRFLQYNYILKYSETFAKLTVLENWFPKHILCSAVYFRLPPITSEYLRCFYCSFLFLLQCIAMIHMSFFLCIHPFIGFSCKWFPVRNYLTHLNVLSLVCFDILLCLCCFFV